ncbi:MAG: GTPase ObgE, partial [Chloroflexi bacterium]|nr:GTPase ObgE [Chloroflexota bacterium]
MYDRVEIIVSAGKGGNGVVSMRREKFVPYGGPDGGDGGDGGNVIFRADASPTSLRSFKHKRIYRAGSGGDGKGKKMHGRNGEDLIIPVPLGTMVIDKTQFTGDALIADLERAGQQATVAIGGKGGLGNIHYASSINQTPHLAQKGETGEEKALILELRLIADVGIIGFPNAGKSTLLSNASAARPKIADYPFTTLEPALGVVEVGRERLVMAEIPGLVAGAHLGKGLGHDFLRHITRTKIVLHLVDGNSASPVEDMVMVNVELSLYDSALAKKPQLVAVNKIDLPQVKARLAEIKAGFSDSGVDVNFIAASTGEGVSALMQKVAERLQALPGGNEVPLAVPKKIFRPQPADARSRVRKDGDAFVVMQPDLERLVAGSDTSSIEVRGQLRQRVIRVAGKALEKAGIKPGDKVRCG